VPILGVNAGTVGFLAEVEPARISAAPDRLASGAYEVSERMTLRATLPDGTEIDALNDVVIEKAVSQHVVGISVVVAGETLAEYRADAVIVASPTGSTAYTFSAGGPLVDPEVEALIVTAVAPHNLFGRAIVFGPDVELEIGITGERSAGVNSDGRAIGALEPGEAVRVRRGPHRDRLIRLEPRNFARTVKDKFRIHDV
jgi:NAD+ kinase